MLERLSVCEFTTHRWSFWEDVVRYATEGINQIGVWRTKMADFDFDEAAEHLFEMKMKVSSLHWAGGFTGADGSKFVDAVDDGVAAVRLAAKLGADCLIVHPGAQNGHTDRHARRIFTSAIDNLAQAAADFGTKIALEPMPHQPLSPWTFYRSFSETIELVSGFDPDHVGIVLDLFHVGHLAEVYSQLPTYIDRVALVQIADRKLCQPHHVACGGNRFLENRIVPGDGGILIDRWVDKLDRCGYAGAFELEVHGAGFSQQNYRSTIDRSLEYLCSSKRSFNSGRRVSEAELERALRRKQPAVPIQSRW